MKKIYLIFALLPLAFTAGAQGLNKEITIEKEIVPELRAATRLDVSHNILAPQFRSQQLAVSERDMGVNINPDAAPLVPVYDMNSSKLNRGYLRLGYLPEYNAKSGPFLLQNEANFVLLFSRFSNRNDVLRERWK